MFWKKSDADYINSIRRWIGWSKRSKYFWAVLSIVQVGNVIALTLVLNRIAVQWNEGAWLGFVAGVFTAFCWCGFGMALFMFLASATMRPWRLLLDYHDRLQKAGLLQVDRDDSAK